MIRDSIVDEVRQARDDYARRFNYDLWAIYEDLKRQEKSADRPIVNRSEKTQTPMHATAVTNKS